MVIKLKIGFIFLFLLIESNGLVWAGHVNKWPGQEIQAGQDKTGGVKKDPVVYQTSLTRLNTEFQSSMERGDTISSRKLLNAILKALREANNDNLTVSNSNYYIGVFYLISGKYSEAVNWLKLSSSMRIQINQNDEIHAKCLFNLGIAYSKLGDLRQMEQYILLSLDIETKIYGESSLSLVSGLSALVTAYIGQDEYDKAIVYGNKALDILNRNVIVNFSEAAIIYANMGVCHARQSDYSKAVLYLEEAESFYKKYQIQEDEKYINLLNSLAVTYYFLGMNEKSDEYFSMGVSKAGLLNSTLSLNFLNSFAIILGNTGNKVRGEELVRSAMEKARIFHGLESRDYIEMVRNYAEYLRTFKIDLKKSLDLYEQCMMYLSSHPGDLSLKGPVLLGYSLALSDNDAPEKGLEMIQKLIFSDIITKGDFLPLENPKSDMIEPVQWSINVFKAKYRILWDIYLKNGNTEYLLAASETSELIISLLEKVRINISEEESRIVLGDRYRDSYLFTIRDFDLCFKITGRKEFLDKAFVYAEKSKVAGLLASTRELKASQFHIPADAGDLEKKLRKEVSFYEARISAENMKISPDASLIAEWKGFVIDATQKRDSLVRMFEEKYPEYYSIKYNTEVIKPADIPIIAGRNANYLNYVVSDSVIYILLVNRKALKLFTVPIDSGFFADIKQFRYLLSVPLDNVKSGLSKFITVGNNLFRKVIEPVKKDLISGQLLISPDNILSYIPFEAIPELKNESAITSYGEIPFMMKDYNISYTYSATLLSESLKKDYSRTNSLIAFAPVYTGKLNVDSILKSRQARKAVLYDLKYARMEAEYVTALTDGKLFLNNKARESVFKSEAGKYDIIHLAMHTLINDQYPMYSKLLFYQGKDTVDDGNLNTYEVYGLPLKAKMVILSSCNTGAGLLHSGEGILSLARGFIYSGGQSVVMSMWEIEDRSGADIIKDFYKYLKKGDNKSTALRKARLRYLKNADMLRSHPYFWSSLVIYGNNAPLYPSGRGLIITGIIIIIMIGSGFLYYNRRFR